MFRITPDAPEKCPERPEHAFETRTNRPEIPAPGPISQKENPCARVENVIIPYDLEIPKTSIPAPKTYAPGARCQRENPRARDCLESTLGKIGFDAENPSVIREVAPENPHAAPSFQPTILGRGVGKVLNTVRKLEESQIEFVAAPRTKNEVGIKLTEEESFPSLQPSIFGRGIGDTYLQALRHRDVCATVVVLSVLEGSVVPS